jgi:TPR repeat protein
LKLSADQGHIPALAYFAVLLLPDYPLKSNCQATSESLRTATNAGFIEARFRYPHLCHVDQRFSGAFRKTALYSKLAAGQEFVEHQMTYATYLATGDGFEMNASEAEHYYLQATSSHCRTMDLRIFEKL